MAGLEKSFHVLYLSTVSASLKDTHVTYLPCIYTYIHTHIYVGHIEGGRFSTPCSYGTAGALGYEPELCLSSTLVLGSTRPSSTGRKKLSHPYIGRPTFFCFILLTNSPLSPGALFSLKGSISYFVQYKKLGSVFCVPLYLSLSLGSVGRATRFCQSLGEAQGIAQTHSIHLQLFPRCTRYQVYTGTTGTL